jgi:hypothetical protein
LLDQRSQPPLLCGVLTMTLSEATERIVTFYRPSCRTIHISTRFSHF